VGRGGASSDPVAAVGGTVTITDGSPSFARSGSIVDLTVVVNGSADSSHTRSSSSSAEPTRPRSQAITDRFSHIGLVLDDQHTHASILRAGAYRRHIENRIRAGNVTSP
jgi:hypothetical protein